MQSISEMTGNVSVAIQNVLEDRYQALIHPDYRQDKLFREDEHSSRICQRLDTLFKKARKVDQGMFRELQDAFYQKIRDQDSQAYALLHALKCKSFLQFLDLFAQDVCYWKNLTCLNDHIGCVLNNLDHPDSGIAMLFGIPSHEPDWRRIHYQYGRLATHLRDMGVAQIGCVLRATTRIREDRPQTYCESVFDSLYYFRRDSSRESIIGELECIAYGEKRYRNQIDADLSYRSKERQWGYEERLMLDGKRWNLVSTDSTRLSAIEFRLLSKLINIKLVHCELAEAVRFWHSHHLCNRCLQSVSVKYPFKNGLIGLLAYLFKSKKSINLSEVIQTTDQITQKLQHDSICFLMNQGGLSWKRMIRLNEGEIKILKTAICLIDFYFHQDRKFFMKQGCKNSESIMQELVIQYGIDTVDYILKSIDGNDFQRFEEIIKGLFSGNPKLYPIGYHSDDEGKYGYFFSMGNTHPFPVGSDPTWDYANGNTGYSVNTHPVSPAMDDRFYGNRSGF